MCIYAGLLELKMFLPSGPKLINIHQWGLSQLTVQAIKRAKTLTTSDLCASRGTPRSNSLTTVFEQQFLLKQKNSPVHHQENKFLIFSLKTKDWAPLVLLFYIQVEVHSVYRFGVQFVSLMLTFFIAWDLPSLTHCAWESRIRVPSHASRSQTHAIRFKLTH